LTLRIQQATGHNGIKKASAHFNYFAIIGKHGRAATNPQPTADGQVLSRPDQGI
jgi:hypothetical protein